MISIFGNKNKKSLKGRIALITGASRGIGAAVAKAFAKEGAHVILLARTIGALEELDDIIKSEGGKATLLPFNLSDTNKIAEIGPSIAKKFGKLDIFIGNAGILGSLSPVAMSDENDWEEVMKINYFANYRLIHTLDPLLRGSDAGRSIFVTSSAAQAEKPFWGAYAASKAALEKMVRTYANEVKHSPLKVNIIDPGKLRTNMRAKAYPGEDVLTLPEPETIVKNFLELASPDFEETGKVVKVA